MEVFGLFGFHEQAASDEHAQGQQILSRLRDKLEERGYHPTDFGQRSFYGWELSIVSPSEKATLVLQFVDEWLLILNTRRRGLARLTGLLDRNDSELPGIVGQSLGELGAENLRWLSRREYESG